MNVTLLLAGLILATPVTEPGYYLPKDAAKTVSGLIQLDKKLPGQVQLAASIQKDHVLVTAKNKAGKRVLGVTLRHSEQASKAAERIGSVALELKPGPTPDRLVKALVMRIKQGKGGLPWRKTRTAPAMSNKDRDQLHQRFEQAVYYIQIGRPDEAKKRLQRLPQVISPGMRLRAARLWFVLGAWK